MSKIRLLGWLRRHPRGRKTGPASKLWSGWADWRSYLRHQGRVIVLLVVVGGVLAGASHLIFRFIKSTQGQMVNGGKVINYLIVLKSTDNAQLTDYEDVRDFSRISVFTHTDVSKTGSAMVVIYGVKDDGNAAEINRIQSTNSSWSSWVQNNQYSRIRLIVERPPEQGSSQVHPTITPEKPEEDLTEQIKVSVIVYLEPKPKP